ncbi:ammonium transporter [Anthocerotibacter panamensis]|uniref:ammonium transporter n=1 Tax=Anthocerotibacter panamensis TaxID=2857077 RepID=UPI001C407622|nr:ammonium transporter [Anthocerotibacter panamensis]
MVELKSKLKIPLFAVLGTVAMLSLMGFAAHAAGDSTGAAVDWSRVSKSPPDLTTVANTVGNLKVGLNMTWVLMTGFLVFFMQAGFALVEVGFCRAKNAAHTMMMNLGVFCVGLAGYFICGFAFMFGGFGETLTLGDTSKIMDGMLQIGGLDVLGTKGFFLQGDFYDVSVLTLFLFQLVFMDTAATIPTGSTAERISWKGFLLMGLWVSMFIYPVIGCWVWGGGLLADLGVNAGLGHGAVDFAGSGVVHMVGGAVALAGAIVIGPRIGKYGRDGSVNAIPGHNLPLAVLGVIILFFGWFGFNPGSTLAATDLRIANVAVTTMIAGAFGGLAGMFRMWIFEGKPDPGYTCNGVLAGLVAITAPCAFVGPFDAMIIGILAGGWVCDIGLFIERKLKIDDPVGAIAVHFCNGAFGLVCVGIFADGTYGDGWNGVKGTVTGLLHGSGVGQLLAQLAECAAIIVVAFGFSFVFFTVLKAIGWLRVSQEDELAGLDVPEMGIWGYPDPEASFAPPTMGGSTAAPTLGTMRPQPQQE